MYTSRCTVEYRPLCQSVQNAYGVLLAVRTGTPRLVRPFEDNTRAAQKTQSPPWNSIDAMYIPDGEKE